ncbi:MAG: hypothetical protein J0H08_13980 [Rhizobiales bacterium]|nr:hypothetical protein [Hyphomicrobiales bacterium]
MHKLLLTASAALLLAGLPAVAQSTDCPPGTTTADGKSPVTCDNDDNSDDTTGMTDDSSAGMNQNQQNGGGNPLSDTDAGQGVADTINNAGDGNNNNNNNNK